MEVSKRIGAFYAIEGELTASPAALIRTLLNFRLTAFDGTDFFGVDTVDFYNNGKPKTVTLYGLDGLTVRRAVLKPDAVLIAPLGGIVSVREYLSAENDDLNIAEKALYMALKRASLAPIAQAGTPEERSDFERAIRDAVAGKIAVTGGATYTSASGWLATPVLDISPIANAYHAASEAFARKSGTDIFLPDRERVTATEVSKIDNACRALPSLIVENVNAGFEALGLDLRLSHRGCQKDQPAIMPEETEGENDGTDA